MTDTDHQEYRLKEGVDRVVRAGLVLEGDATINAHPGIEREHGDVLEPAAESNAEGSS